MNYTYFFLSLNRTRIKSQTCTKKAAGKKGRLHQEHKGGKCMGIGCRIITDFKRPDKSLIERFRGLQVADLDDNMARTQAVRHKIISFSGKPLLGTAFTVKLPHGDNLMFRAAIRYVKPGDVIIIDAGGFEDRAVMGEVTTKYAMAMGAAGIVCDGALRDSEVLSTLDFPIFARFASPNGPFFNGPGEVNVPIVCGGQLVTPGDIVVGDRDGIIFINPEYAEEVLRSTIAASEKEDAMIRELESTGTLRQQFVWDRLKEIGCTII